MMRGEGERMTTIDLEVLKEAIRICRSSGFYHTLDKAMKHEAVIHTYRTLTSIFQNLPQRLLIR